MGKESRLNPRAVAAAQPRVPSLVGHFDFEVVFEINKEKMAELVILIDAAKAAGQDPRTAVPICDPEKNPEWFDYVVYNRPWIGRKSPLVDQIPFARVRWNEHLRIPLVELKGRADEVVAANEPREASH